MQAASLLRLLVLSVATLSWGCGSGSAATKTAHMISGDVRDAQTARGIAKASVEFVSDALETAETVSDGDGRFNIAVEVSDGVEFGHISARHPDYEPAAARSVYFDGIQHVLVLELYRKPSK